MTAPTILTRREGNIAYVTLNRPEKKNAMNLDMIQALCAEGKRLKRDKTLRAVILEGSQGVFCSGMDLKGLFANKKMMVYGYLQTWLPWTNRFQKVNLIWQEIPVPVIATVEGYCFGAGLQLALGADFIVATPAAKLSIMESKWGLVPDMGLTQTLRHRLGVAKAKELTFTARIIDGTTAASIGLIEHVAEQPIIKALELIAEIELRSPDAIAAGKDLFNRSWGASRWFGLRLERFWQRKLLINKNQSISMKTPAGEMPNYRSRSVR